MPDTALENAQSLKSELLKKKKELQKELEQVELQLRETNRFISAWHAFSTSTFLAKDEWQKDTESYKKGTSKKQSAKERATGNSKKEYVAEQARKIILERGKPVSRADLFKELISRGCTINGKNPEMVLSTMLWRVPEKIIRLKKGGYWLPDKPLEEDSSSFDEEDLFR